MSVTNKNPHEPDEPRHPVVGSVRTGGSLKKRWLVAISLVIASGCATPPKSTAHAPRPFQISSEASDFGMIGTLSGTVEIQPDALVVVVKDGSIYSRLAVEFDATLVPMIAGPGEQQAEIVDRGDPQTIGPFAKDERRSLTAPLNFTMPLPKKFDPATQWLVFEFRVAKHATAYVCEAGNLLGTQASETRRDGQYCWANPAH